MSTHSVSIEDIHPGRHGVVTLSGYGISVKVDRGHLLVEDGIGANRQRARFPRVGHGLKRLVVIGSDGMISLSALRWLADQKAAFVMLERDGSVLATTDRKSTRLNSSHLGISYAVFCLKKKIQVFKP